MRTARQIVQLAALFLFIVLVVQTRWTPAAHLPAPVFLRLDPLSALTTWLSPTHAPLLLFVPALVLLALTALLGRFFCGWLCPLGTVIDGSDALLTATHARRRQWNQPTLKLYILAFVLIAAPFGTQAAWLVDPIPLLTRVAATVAYPMVAAAYNLGVIAARPVLLDLNLRAYPLDHTPTFALSTVVLVTFLAILALGVFGRRTWCRNLCPLGALLGMVGYFGLWRRRVGKSLHCGRCVPACKMAAIPAAAAEKGVDCSHTVTPECIQCYDCLTCPQPGITRIGLFPPRPETDLSLRLSKRRFVAALGLGALYGAASATGAGRRTDHPRLLRPPGANVRSASGTLERMSEAQFRDLCLRCGNCMKACITGGLQPAVVESGFDGVFTPILVPRMGHCEQSCNACAEACPSGALRPFTVQEKSRIIIGLAAIVTKSCFSWRRGGRYRLCLVCAEHCPYGAIDIIEDGDQRRPVVNPDKCVGCGQCERVCPHQPEAAIIVTRR